MQVQLNPLCSSYQTPTDKLQATLSHAERMFPALGSFTPERKKEFETCLKEAFLDLRNTQENKRAAARLFHMYASFLYGGHMEYTRQMFQLSLALQLDLEIPPLPSTLEQVPPFLSSQPLAFKALEERLKEKNFARELFSDPRCFDIAKALVGLGASLFNLKDKTTVIEERFVKIYADASEIYMHINTPESRWLAAEITYNTGRPFYRMREKDKATVQGALATLEPLNPILDAEGDTPRARQMRAQILNITMMEITPLVQVDKNLLRQQHQLISAAVTIAESTPDFSVNLKTMFLNNKFAIAFQAHKAGIKLASDDELMNWCRQIIQEMQVAGHDFYYHAGYYMNVAAYELMLNHNYEALTHLVTAEEINRKFNQSNAAVEKIRAEATVKFRAQIIEKLRSEMLTLKLF